MEEMELRTMKKTCREKTISCTPPLLLNLLRANQTMEQPVANIRNTSTSANTSNTKKKIKVG